MTGTQTAPALFVSLFAYRWAKGHWPRITDAILREQDLGEKSEVAGFRTVARLRKLATFAFAPSPDVLVDKARCVVAGTFLRSGSGLWVSVDEDVDASRDALGLLLNAGTAGAVLQRQDGGGLGITAGGPHAHIVYGAMKTRAGFTSRYNVGFEGVDGNARNSDGSIPEVSCKTGELFPVSHGGAALMAVPRPALEKMCEAFPELYFDEEHTEGSSIIDRNPALFMQDLIDGEMRGGRPVRGWVGEDVAFSRRAEAAGVARYGFIHPGIIHAGIPSL